MSLPASFPVTRLISLEFVAQTEQAGTFSFSGCCTGHLTFVWTAAGILAGAIQSRLSIRPTARG